jgi:hypothetical protein
MLEVLQFVMSNIWVFLGTVVLLGVVFDGIVSIIRALRGDKVQSVGGKIRGKFSPG